MINLLYAIFICTFLGASYTHTDVNEYEQHKELVEKLRVKENGSVAKRRNRLKKNIVMNYQDEELVDIINMLAAQKEVNVVLPVAHPITTKVNFSLDYKVTIDQAWDILYTILNLAGYSLIPQNNMYEIVKTDKDTAREPLPLYIGTRWQDLPDNDMRIRYVYYFTNIRASDDANFEIKVMLERILPETARVVISSASNSMIVADKAQNIRGAMEVVTSLDQVGFKETMEYLELRYYPADLIADLFMKDIIPTAADASRYRLDTKVEADVSYFSRHLKMIPLRRTNSILILGKQQAVDRVLRFIKQYIDVPQESADSILHMYQLQYLNAAKFAKVLQNVVDVDKLAGVTGQAKAEAVGGLERFLGEQAKIIIRADTPEGTSEEGIFSGGNKLIVAATNEDWVRIKKLIEDLDTPRPQVIIKVLIAELTLNELKQIGSLIRNPDCVFPTRLDAQSAQSGGIFPGSPPATLRSDLLEPLQVATALTPGSTAISVNDSDGRTWLFLDILNRINTRRIISNPHILVTNNQTGYFRIAEERLLPGPSRDLVGSGATQIERQWIRAPLELRITPRISSAETVSLSIEINIDRFQTAGDPANQALETRENRKVITNASARNGDVLAFGGLSRVDTSNELGETPLLGRLPIIGYFFKRRREDETKINLTVFISPIIVPPRLRGGIGDYTRDYVDLTKQYTEDAVLFDSLQDPITRWFFAPTDVTVAEEIDDFLEKDELTRDLELALFDEGVLVGEESVDTTLPMDIDDVSVRAASDDPQEPPLALASHGQHERVKKLRDLLEQDDSSTVMA